MAPVADSPEILPITPKTAKSSPGVDYFDAATTTPEMVIDSLVRNGGCFVKNLLSTQEVDTIVSDIRPYIDADVAWTGDFFPKETRRVCSLAEKSPTFIHRVLANPLYLEVCDKMLSSEIESWTGDVYEKSISPPQVNATIAFSIGPGARAQGLHRDSIAHHNRHPAITAAEYKMGRDSAIDIFVAGKKATKANGTTRFIPGSHLEHYLEKPDESRAIYAEMDPGDAFIMLASCYHGGSANTTENEERLMLAGFMTKGYLRQEENMYLGVSQEAVKQYPRHIQDILGYGLSAPFLGWVDLKHPRKVLYPDEDLDDDMY
ncbi:hypothetical protein A1O1_00461 [Capronia coronata CBS 617.96]|uniref:Phytanoyl-CoA dioxygenase family protein n=1 Tax=Capronia coronata CBS 617.96 TaxID=1182541 RepID=W9Z1C2_9EURO|nr:uncharacterized protein A1O1_00461 [Capronia coronata CBS 617.96]EXJ95341.1 hypothetical protein A1O1_00461 [Capronia coronata CBS 617.96]